MQRKRNTAKIRRTQRLTNIKLAEAYRTTSYEALCVLTGIFPSKIELENKAKLYHITRGKKKPGKFFAAQRNNVTWICFRNGCRIIVEL